VVAGREGAQEGGADTAAGAAMGRNFSQISHGLTGRHWTMACVPDTEQDVTRPHFWPGLTTRLHAVLS
jgi:hypothetical protein